MSAASRQILVIAGFLLSLASSVSAQRVAYQEVEKGPVSVQFFWVRTDQLSEQYGLLKAAVTCGTPHLNASEMQNLQLKFGIRIVPELHPAHVRLGFTFPPQHMDTAVFLMKEFMLNNERVRKECIYSYWSERRQLAKYYSNDPDTLLRRAIEEQYWLALGCRHFDVNEKGISMLGEGENLLVVNDRLTVVGVGPIDSSLFAEKMAFFNKGQEFVGWPELSKAETPNTTYLGPKRMLATVAMVFATPSRDEMAEHDAGMELLADTLETRFPEVKFYRPGEYAQHQFVLVFKAENWMQKKAEIDAFMRAWHTGLSEEQLLTSHAVSRTACLLRHNTNTAKAKELSGVRGLADIDACSDPLDTQQFRDHFNEPAYKVFVYGAQR